MAKKVQQKSVALTTDAEALAEVSGYADSGEFLKDIQRGLAEFRSGKMDPEHARIVVASHRNYAAGLALEFEHARLTKRLEEKNPALPPFKIGQ